ncbi:MAG: hypothetical protein M1826_006873 [Phylliscum demangeonii]|nr:MAG: hypothetical protein M1826_006873 [Phylliscum demangeonii]
MFNLLVPCLFAPALLAFASYAQSNAKASTAPSLTNETLAALIARAGIPGAAALISDGNMTRIAVAGLADVERNVRMKSDAVFRVGSVTKTFTATVVLRLVDEGRVQLDAPIGQYLPGIVPSADTMTIRHLLSMRSGLFDYTIDPRVYYLNATGDYATGRRAPDFHWTPAALAAVVRSHGLDFAPGTDSEYSSSNFIILGLLVEHVTGCSFEAELDRIVLGPLRLRHTSMNPIQRTRPPLLHAHGYAQPRLPFRAFTIPAAAGAGDNTTITLGDTEAFSYSFGWTAGALRSNVHDLAVFFRALLRDALLSRRTMAEFRQLIRLPGTDGAQYGLGVAVDRTACGPSWGHKGVTAGYFAAVDATPDAGRVVVVLINADVTVIGQPDAASQALDDFFCQPVS